MPTFGEPILEVLVVNALSALPLAVIAVLAERWIRRPALTHGLWLVVLLRLLMPPIVEVPVVLGGSGASGPGLLTLPLTAITGTLESSTATASETAESLGGLPSVGHLLLMLGLAGSLFVLLLAGLRTLRLGLALRGATQGPRAVVERVEKLAGSLGLTSVPPVLTTELAISPMVWCVVGYRRLVLPRALIEQLTPQELDALLTHELAHLRRGDHWVRHLELAVTAAFWWYPLTWLACRRLRRAEEACCDLAVRRALPGHRRAYADCLLKTLRYLADTPRPFAVLASGLGAADQLKGRLVMILSEPLPRTLSSPLRWLFVTLCLGALVMTPVVADPAPAKGAAADDSAAYVGEPLRLSVEEQPLIDVLRRLAKVSGLNVVVEPTADLSTRVTWDENAIPWDQALEGLLVEAELDYALQGTVLWVGPNPPETLPLGPFYGESIDISYQEADLRSALEDFGRWMDFELDLDPTISGTVSLELQDVPVDQALSILLRLSELEMTTEAGKLQIIPFC